MNFSFDRYVTDIQKASTASNPNDAVRSVLLELVFDPEAVAAVTPIDGDDEVKFFENERISIWRCRFQPRILMPPHEHLVDVHIAGYAGIEKEIMYCRNGDTLHYDRTTLVRPGEVVSLDKDEIHAVTGAGDLPSQALHVYMGPLTRIKRSLFDWSTGERIPFSQENFDQMKKPAHQWHENY